MIPLCIPFLQYLVRPPRGPLFFIAAAIQTRNTALLPAVLTHTRILIEPISLVTLLLVWICGASSTGCSDLSDRYSDVVLQMQANDCGPAALTMVLGSFGSRQSLGDVRSIFHLTNRGASVTEMIRVAGLLGLRASGWKLSFGALGGIQLPVVILLDGDHYVVVDSVRGETMYARDPSAGRIAMTEGNLQGIWDGTTILFQPGPETP